MEQPSILRADFLEIATILTISTYVGNGSDRRLGELDASELIHSTHSGGWLFKHEHYVQNDDYECDEELVEVLEIQSGALRLPNDGATLFADKQMQSLFQSQPAALQIKQGELDVMITDVENTPRTNPWAISALNHNVCDVLSTPVPNDIVLDFDSMSLRSIGDRVMEEVPYPKIRNIILRRLDDMAQNEYKQTLDTLTINVNGRRTCSAERTMSAGYKAARLGLH